MTDHPHCEHAGETRITGVPISLEESLDRFEREAERGVLQTGRYRCSYYVWGKGPPLTFIHGLADQARSFIPAISAISEHFRCIAYELPEGEADEADLHHYRHADMVEDLFCLLDHLQVRQSYLFGSSFGSTVTLAALRARPDRVPRAILQGGFAHRPLAPAERMLARMARFWPGRLRHVPLRRAVMHYYHHAPFVNRSPAFWQFQLTNGDPHTIRSVAGRALMMHALDLRPLLPEIHQPVLIICGDYDPLVGKTCEQALLDGLPSVGRVEFENCGHFPYLTHPEALAEVVRRFLTPGGSIK